MCRPWRPPRAAHARREDLGRPRRRRGRARAERARDRPASRPRGHRPQAFTGLRRRGLTVRHPERTVATADHSVPTTPRNLPILDAMAAAQVDQLTAELRRVRHPAPRPRLAEPGHRPRDRAGARAHPAGHDDRLRRRTRRPTARSARWRSASARPRSRWCWRRSACCSAARRRTRSGSTGGSRPASPRRT